MSNAPFRIPGPEKKWQGTFPGNYAGNVWQTHNIDLERHPGRVALADRLKAFKTGLGIPYKFVRTNATATDQWFAFIHSTDIIRNGNSVITAGTWITDDTTGTFNDPRDMLVHELANGEERLLCSRETNIAILNKTGGANVWDDDWWTTVASGPALTSLTHHPLARLQRLVAVGDKQTGVPVIHTLDKDDVVQTSRLTFPADYTVRNIDVSSNRYWIGLQHDRDGKARIIEWDGFSLTYNNEYDLVGTTPLCKFVVKDIPYVITDKGFIFRYNGGGFEKVQSFGLEEYFMTFSTSITAENTINNYGAFVDGDIVYLLVGMPVRTSGTAFFGVRRGRSGVWIFDTRNMNLYHHMAVGEYDDSNDKNFGCSPLAGVGAIVKPPTQDRLIVGASVYTGGASFDAATQTGLYQRVGITPAAPNRGYIVTPYIPAAEVEATWEALWVKFKRFVDSGNRLVVKWRAVDPTKNPDTVNNRDHHPLQAEGTWASTTTFTSVVPTGVAEGDEVEVMTGDNAGCLFKISTLSATPDSSTTITVTLSEAAPVNSTDKSFFRFDNFKTETAISSTTVGNQRVAFTAPAHGEWVQLKLELRGVGMEIDELIPVNNTKTAPEQG